MDKEETVLLEMGNFPTYGNFWILTGRRNYGEFPIKIMGNFGSIRFYSNILCRRNKLAPKVLIGVKFLADFHNLGFIFQLGEIKLNDP